MASMRREATYMCIRVSNQICMARETRMATAIKERRMREVHALCHMSDLEKPCSCSVQQREGQDD